MTGGNAVSVHSNNYNNNYNSRVQYFFLMKYEVYKYAEIRLDVRLIRGFDITFSLASVDKTTIFLVLVG